jgi:hypothetical protein
MTNWETTIVKMKKAIGPELRLRKVVKAQRSITYANATVTISPRPIAKNGGMWNVSIAAYMQ